LKVHELFSMKEWQKVSQYLAVLHKYTAISPQKTPTFAISLLKGFHMVKEKQKYIWSDQNIQVRIFYLISLFCR
jgi:hypothetical protein